MQPCLASFPLLVLLLLRGLLSGLSSTLAAMLASVVRYGVHPFPFCCPSCGRPDGPEELCLNQTSVSHLQPAPQRWDGPGWGGAGFEEPPFLPPPSPQMPSVYGTGPDLPEHNCLSRTPQPPPPFPPFSLLVCESTVPFCIPGVLYILTPPTPPPTPSPGCHLKGEKIYI